MKNFNMNNIQGTDTDIETSLFEYGFAWIPSNDGKEVMFCYGIGYGENEYNRFDRCSFNSDMDIYDTFDWIDSDSWNQIYSFMGMDKEDFDNMPLTQKIFDLFQYYGYENIFGSSYWNGFKYSSNINRFITVK